jgi:aspartate/methionine/tyrosine aminotransferase
MTNITSNLIEGAMYAFPRVHFSDKAIAEANKNGVPADFMYCMDMLLNTGIMTVPGSGFGQVDGTYHFRITNLVTPTDELVKTLDLLKEFNNEFHAKYS